MQINTCPSFWRLILWCGMGCLLGFGTASLAQDNAPSAEDRQQVDPTQVRQFLRELQADQVMQRDEAEKRLVELGPGVLDYLPQVTSRTSGELKIRLQRIRQSFQAETIEKFFESSRVNLSGRLKLTEAIEKITEQTGNEIQLQGQDGLAGVEVQVAAENQEFWQVIESLMQQADLRIVSFGTTDAELVLAPGGYAAEDRVAPFQDGPFRVEPMFLQTTRPFNGNLPGQLQVSLQVTWEPRLKPVFMQIPMGSVQAVVADGNALSATNPQAAPEIPLNYGGCTTQIDLQVQRPDRSKDRLQSLSGEFSVAVPGERHRFEFQDFAKGSRQTETYGDLTVVLEGARRNGRNYEMRLLVQFGNAQGALDSYRGWAMSNKAFVLDPTGRRLDDVGFNTYAMTNNAVGIAYLFSIAGDPAEHTLVYEAPATITRQTVQYELRDIPLP
ncbi:MAG: hypothetical protein NXI32_16460 [bacterium]|nr:hypothetical protein [bacterium]